MSIRVLLIEDDEDDYLLTSEYLDAIPEAEYDLEWVADGMAAAKGGCDFTAFDVVLCDYRVGGVTGVDIVEAAIRKHVVTPFILLTGHSDREIDFAAMQAGAVDHLVKDQLSPAVLEKAIRYALNAADAARRLKKQTQILEATMEASDVGMAAIDADGAVVAWNYRLAELLVGLTASEAEITESISTVAATPEVVAGEALMLPSAVDGGFFEARLRPLTGGGSTLACIDVTKHKELEDALRGAKEEAERISSAKSAFIARLSHEMRTPLHAVIGFGDMLTSAAPADVGEYSGIIVHSARSLIAKIDQMLELSRLDLGELRRADREIDVRAVLRDAVASATRADDGLAPNLDVAKDIPDLKLRGDQRLLGNAMMELVYNAAKHGAPDGRIGIGASELDDGRISLWVTNRPDPRAMRTDGDSAQPPAIGGDDPGIGLTYVKSVAGLHDAKFELAFDPDVGEVRAAIFVAPIEAGEAEEVDAA